MKVKVCRDFKWRLKKGDIATFAKDEIIKINYYLGLDKGILEEMCYFGYTEKIINMPKKSKKEEAKEEEKEEEKGEKKEKMNFENKMVKMDYDKKKLKKVKILKQKIGEKQNGKRS